jgi:hypothetical protein
LGADAAGSWVAGNPREVGPAGCALRRRAVCSLARVAARSRAARIRSDIRNRHRQGDSVGEVPWLGRSNPVRSRAHHCGSQGFLCRVHKPEPQNRDRSPVPRIHSRDRRRRLVGPARKPGSQGGGRSQVHPARSQEPRIRARNPGRQNQSRGRRRRHRTPAHPSRSRGLRARARNPGRQNQSRGRRRRHRTPARPSRSRGLPDHVRSHGPAGRRWARCGLIPSRRPYRGHCRSRAPRRRAPAGCSCRLGRAVPTTRSPYQRPAAEARRWPRAWLREGGSWKPAAGSVSGTGRRRLT